MTYDDKQESLPSRIVTGQLDLSHRGKESGHPGVANATPARCRFDLPPSDYYAAIRFHILRCLATGTYRTHRQAADSLGVSEAWVGRVAIEDLLEEKERLRIEDVAESCRYDEYGSVSALRTSFRP